MREAAGGVALTSALFAISFFFPILGFLAVLLLPLPVLYYRLKLGRRRGVWVPLICGALMTALLGSQGAALLFFLELLVLGFAMGEILAADYPVEWVFIFPTAALSGLALVAVAMAASQEGMGLGAFMAAHVEENLRQTLSLYESLGATEEAVQLMTEQVGRFRDFLVRILPGLLVTSLFFTIWVNLLALRRLLAMRQIYPPVLNAFRFWRAPDMLVWGVIGSGLTLLVPAGWLKVIGINVLMVLMCVYFFQGMGIVSFFFEKKRLPRGVRIIVYTLIVFQQVLLLAVVGIGFADVWVNFRKIGDGQTS